MRWTVIVLALWLWTTPLNANDAEDRKESALKLSPEEMEIIMLMETLQMMDLAESMEMLEDMDALIEEDHNEDQD
jgi:hypothetical protein